MCKKVEFITNKNISKKECIELITLEDFLKDVETDAMIDEFGLDVVYDETLSWDVLGIKISNVSIPYGTPIGEIVFSPITFKDELMYL